MVQKFSKKTKTLYQTGMKLIALGSITVISSLISIFNNIASGNSAIVIKRFSDEKSTLIRPSTTLIAVVIGAIFIVAGVFLMKFAIKKDPAGKITQEKSSKEDD